MLDVGLYFTYALLVIAVIAAIGLPLINALQSPATLFKSLYGVVALVVVFIIAYALADSTVKPEWAVLGVGEGGVKIIGAGLTVFYITMAVAIIGLIYSEISKVLK